MSFINPPKEGVRGNLGFPYIKLKQLKIISLYPNTPPYLNKT